MQRAGPPALHVAVLQATALAASIAALWVAVMLAKLLLQPQPPAADAIAALFWRYWRSEFVALASIFVLAAVGHRILPPSGHARAAGLGLLVLACTAAGAGLMLGLAEYKGATALQVLPYLVVRQGTLATLTVALHELASRQRRADDAAHQAVLREAEGQRELDAARLTLLQAQIEPHFLFNSLANVRRLLRTDPPAAQALLAALRRYLEEALPLLREERGTLGREAELVQAYLAVHQVRMGARLQAHVDVPEALHGCALPPMLLLTLVENAIKHGVAPLVEGGRIDVAARAERGTLTLTVADTGRGMGSGAGHGTGLANLCARLRALHGSAARLSLRLNEPRGVVAEVTLPALDAAATS